MNIDIVKMRFLKHPTVIKYNITEQMLSTDILENLFKLYEYKKLTQWSYELVCKMLIHSPDNIYDKFVRLKALHYRSKEYNVILYGEALGMVKYLEYCKKTKESSPAFAEFWISQGLTVDEAINLASIHRKEISKKGATSSSKKLKGTSKHSIRSNEFWINQGLTVAEATEKVKSIQTTNGLSFYLEKYGEDQGNQLYQERLKTWKEKIKSSMISKGYWQNPDNYSQIERYRKDVINYTRKSYKEHSSQINPNNKKRGNGFELDHRFSITEGFNHNIPPEVVGHWTNLEVIDEKENASKWARSSITKDQLMENYNSNSRIY